MHVNESKFLYCTSSVRITQTKKHTPTHTQTHTHLPKRTLLLTSEPSLPNQENKIIIIITSSLGYDYPSFRAAGLPHHRIHPRTLKPPTQDVLCCPGVLSLVRSMFPRSIAPSKSCEGGIVYHRAIAPTGSQYSRGILLVTDIPRVARLNRG